jgi:hypothetical protein
MTSDLQDLSRVLFATANQLWTNAALRPDQHVLFSISRLHHAAVPAQETRTAR